MICCSLGLQMFVPHLLLLTFVCDAILQEDYFEDKDSEDDRQRKKLPKASNMSQGMLQVLTNEYIIWIFYQIDF